ncbi:hypothetical protein JTB14_021256 [Gonioctena quinquepunctata]|nr:hypothetical protein JTB14_021256 [Gonioctena quinquepunctata]
MSTEKKKRVRAANFNAEEVRLLIRLALKEKHIFENKQTDSEVWKLKSKTWERIAAVFNASSGQIFRSADTLKLKFDGLKKELKTKVNKNKAETMETGEGHPDYIDKEPKKNANGAWKDWSPAALKSKEHPLLTPRRKKDEDRNKKIENLLELREELVRQQIHHIIQEEKRAQEKHDREMKLLDLQINIKENRS